MHISFPEILHVGGLVLSILIFSANAGVVIPRSNPKLYNVMIMEADLKTPEQCEKTKWSSNLAVEINAFGFWFCKGSVLGRLVDEEFFANIQKADLVRYVLKPRTLCPENVVEPPDDQTVYIYLANSKNNKVNIIEEDDQRALRSEFVQRAMAVLEMEAFMLCKPPALNVTKWGWETLSGVDF